MHLKCQLCLICSAITAFVSSVDVIDGLFLLLADRHTLWRHLQCVVTPLLANILEVMDRFANLDLFAEGKLSRGLEKLWLDILADSQILDLTVSQKPRYEEPLFQAVQSFVQQIQSKIVILIIVCLLLL